MSDFTATYEDAFNLLCGDKIGSGIHRTVYACRIRPELVVKVENDDSRYFANVHEHKSWGDYQHHAATAKWLAPCEYLSPDGRISLQRRADPLPNGYNLPAKMPTFLSDHKRSNFGLIDGNLVCVDYAMTIPGASLRLKTVHWSD